MFVFAKLLIHCDCSIKIVEKLSKNVSVSMLAMCFPLTCVQLTKMNLHLVQSLETHHIDDTDKMGVIKIIWSMRARARKEPGI